MSNFDAEQFRAKGETSPDSGWFYEAYDEIRRLNKLLEDVAGVLDQIADPGLLEEELDRTDPNYRDIRARIRLARKALSYIRGGPE